MYAVRRGSSDDLHALLALLDAAVGWLVARGGEGQWGAEAFSASPSMVEHLAQISADGELRLAHDSSGRIVGGYVLGARPGYAPAIVEPERYLEAMVTARTHAGQGIGALLVADAVARAHAAGASILRADCWAAAPRLVRWYEDQGFERGDIVHVGSWPAQLLVRPLRPPP